MESLFQRMLSIIIRNRSDCFEQDIDEIENEQNKQLNYLQECRRSTADIHRCGSINEQLTRINDQEGSSDKQITTRLNTFFHYRKHCNSMGKFVMFK